MALKWKGRVRETTVTTGTGALTLGGAVTSYGTFASLMSTGDTCYGTVAHRATTEWEDCLFTMEADGTLTRTTVIDGSSGAGTPVSLSAGTKDVFLGLPPAIVETLLGASLVTLGTASYVTSERVLTAGSGISLTDGGAGGTITVANTAQGVTDHGALTGLTDDDHTQYALLAGRAGGQTVDGGTAASEKLILNSTAHATKGLVQFGNSTNKACYDEANGKLIVGALATDASQSGGTPRVITAYAGRNTAFIRSHSSESSSASTISAGYEMGNSFGGNFVQMCKFQALDGSFDIENVLPGTASQGFNLKIASVTKMHIRAAYTQETVINSNTTTAAPIKYFDNNSSGTAGAGFGSQVIFRLESSTTDNTQAAYLTVTWGVATHASREGILSLYATDYGGDRLGLQITGNGSATEIGFFGVTPTVRPSAYTQTYATADKTHADFTASDLTDNTTGTANTTLEALPDPADTPASADALRDDLVANLIPALRNNYADLADQHNKLKADLADLKQFVNSLVDDLQSLGLAQ